MQLDLVVDFRERWKVGVDWPTEQVGYPPSFGELGDFEFVGRGFGLIVKVFGVG